MADVAERRERIRSGAVALAEAIGGHAVIEEALLDEVTALVEWPVPLARSLRRALPASCRRKCRSRRCRIISAISRCATRDGKLCNEFITVANIESRDPDKVRDGNERVVRPRLADAAFFWDSDRRERLESASRERSRA